MGVAVQNPNPTKQTFTNNKRTNTHTNKLKINMPGRGQKAQPFPFQIFSNSPRTTTRGMGFRVTTEEGDTSDGVESKALEPFFRSCAPFTKFRTAVGTLQQRRPIPPQGKEEAATTHWGGSTHCVPAASTEDPPQKSIAGGSGLAPIQIGRVHVTKFHNLQLSQ